MTVEQRAADEAERRLFHAELLKFEASRCHRPGWAIDLSALNDAQMRDRCRSLARTGGSEHEIAAALRWSLGMVRRALSPERPS